MRQLERIIRERAGETIDSTAEPDAEPRLDLTREVA